MVEYLVTVLAASISAVAILGVVVLILFRDILRSAWSEHRLKATSVGISSQKSTNDFVHPKLMQDRPVFEVPDGSTNANNLHIHIAKKERELWKAFVVKHVVPEVSIGNPLPQMTNVAKFPAPKSIVRNKLQVRGIRVRGETRGRIEKRYV